MNAVGGLPEIRPIAGWPGYGVSADGRVWTSKVRKKGWHIVSGSWSPLACAVQANGYKTVCFSHQGNEKTIKVHRLVLKEFVGPCPPGMQGCHNDGNRLNNSWGGSAHTGPVGPGEPSTSGFWCAGQTFARMLAQDDSWSFAGLADAVAPVAVLTEDASR